VDDPPPVTPLAHERVEDDAVDRQLADFDVAADQLRRQLYRPPPPAGVRAFEVGADQLEAVEVPFGASVAGPFAPVVEDGDRGGPDGRFFSFSFLVALQVGVARPPGPHVALGSGQLIVHLAHQVAVGADRLASLGVNDEAICELLILGQDSSQSGISRSSARRLWFHRFYLPLRFRPTNP